MQDGKIASDFLFDGFSEIGQRFGAVFFAGEHAQGSAKGADFMRADAGNRFQCLFVQSAQIANRRDALSFERRTNSLREHRPEFREGTRVAEQSFVKDACRDGGGRGWSGDNIGKTFG